METYQIVGLVVLAIIVLILAIRYGFLGTLLEVLLSVGSSSGSASTSSSSSSSSDDFGGFGGGDSGGGGSSGDW